MMPRRRDLLIAGLGVGALAAAEGLRPRRRLVLLKSNAKIEDVLPQSFGAWQAHPSSGLVGPEMAGRLAKTLYSETVQRTYDDKVTGATVMLLAAYGDTQSDLLQLHRPESCYPAVGFTVTLTQPDNVRVGQGVLPARRVIAQTSERTENILYWTRLGERIPQSGGQQRDARLQNAMEGYVADGILVRCSVVGEPEESFKVLRRFVPEMLAASRKDGRPALIGTKLSSQIA
ncbi:MAG: EpsI family protein [Phenylobacterium sp.]|uniref:exosortase-associated protein EpsI, V-type n=1 Tax=Phenylobacterium sp. TaxID=1871053 RepID=UPI001A415070|nr:exosortase-associated protein EpsI, V-type [Phenylobacterium sp.]MBL8770974.1 EpsI family protein [Phenylobacterium sp.]